jgi:hypothetical protein
MANGIPSNSIRPAAGSLIDRLMNRAAGHPGSFVCGVRVVTGEVAGESRNWRYRSSAVDRLVSDGIVTLNHGTDVVLRLRIASGEVANTAELRLRTNWVVRSAQEQTSGAQVLVTFDGAELDRLPSLTRE